MGPEGCQNSNHCENNLAVNMLEALHKQKTGPLDERSDYSSWRVRVLTACTGKGLDTVFDMDDHIDSGRSNDAASPASAGCGDEHSSSQTGKITQTMPKQASNILISALGDHPLRVVQSVIG